MKTKAVLTCVLAVVVAAGCATMSKGPSDEEQIASLVTEKMLTAEGIISSETLIAFRAFSQHDLERMFSVGMD